MALALPSCRRDGRPVLTAALLVIVATGCSRLATESAGAARPTTVAGPSGNACDRKLIGRADVAGLLSEPVQSVETLSGDAQSCVFKTAGYSSVTVALRPGLGHETLSILLSGRGGQEVIPLAGVGERAVWNPTLKEVNAEKHDVLCDIGAIGPATTPATKEKVGPLCNKIFATL